MKQDRDTKIGERAKAIVKAKASMEALRKAQAAPKRPMPKESVTGGSDTVPMTSERKEFLQEMAKRSATPSMAKGGKTMKKTAKTKPFAATKFGAALVKKSADTKGRAMKKFNMGGPASMPAPMLGRLAPMQSKPAPMQGTRVSGPTGGRSNDKSAPVQSGPSQQQLAQRLGVHPAPQQTQNLQALAAQARAIASGMKKGGKVKKAGGGKCYAKGGSIDGIAVKGKTKAKRVTMKKGGYC